MVYCPECFVLLDVFSYRKHIRRKHKSYSMGRVIDDLGFVLKCVNWHTGKRVRVDPKNRVILILQNADHGTQQKVTTKSSKHRYKQTPPATQVVVSKPIVTRSKASVTTSRQHRKFVKVRYSPMLSFNERLSCRYCSGTGALDSNHGCPFCGSS